MKGWRQWPLITMLACAGPLSFGCGGDTHETPQPLTSGGAGNAPPSNAACQDYCADVMSACQGAVAVYATKDVCLAVCAMLVPGDALEPLGNTVACRANEAKLAEREPDDHCPSAGPGGGARCSSDCAAYCALYPQICPDGDAYASDGECLEACSGLTDQERFDVVMDHEGDTLECRLVHLSAAALEPDAHCPHASLTATEPWCVARPE